MSDNCRSCGAKVIWTETERGRRMPVDKEASPEGNLLLMHRAGRAPLAVYQTKEALEALAKEGGLQQHRLYVSHFATCPQSKKWKTKKGGKQ
jgi:hypothetical protein